MRVFQWVVYWLSVLFGGGDLWLPTKKSGELSYKPIVCHQLPLTCYENDFLCSWKPSYRTICISVNADRVITHTYLILYPSDNHDNDIDLN